MVSGVWQRVTEEFKESIEMFLSRFVFCASLAFAFVLSVENTHAEHSGGFNLMAIEEPRVLQKADNYLDEEPRTVTSSRCERSAGGLHDYYSEGDYWWPDPENPKGPFIRRDGETYTDLFLDHRLAMIRLSDIVGCLTSAYLITKDERYAAHAVRHLEAWFVQNSTKMNPNLLYGQAIQGRYEGRSIGVIDTLHLTEVARGAKLLCSSSSFSVECQAQVKQWFRTYLTWINTHEYGVREKNHPNNHGVCWSLQAASFADLVGDEKILQWIREQFKSVYVQKMMDDSGGFPAELARTKPYGYSLFVIDAMAGVAQVASTKKIICGCFSCPTDVACTAAWNLLCRTSRTNLHGHFHMTSCIGMSGQYGIPVCSLLGCSTRMIIISMSGRNLKQIQKHLKSKEIFRFAIHYYGF